MHDQPEPPVRRLHADLDGRLDGYLRTDPVSRALWSTEASIYRSKPVGIVAARSEDDVRLAPSKGLYAYRVVRAAINVPSSPAARNAYIPSNPERAPGLPSATSLGATSWSEWVVMDGDTLPRPGRVSATGEGPLESCF